MDRFTKKLDKPFLFDEICTGYYGIPNHNEVHVATNIANKLGKLEDIEEELGCPLEVREQALKQGYIYTTWHSRDGLEKQEITHLVYDKDIKMWIFKDLEKTKGIYYEMANIPVNGYKKTWWLSETKEE